MKQGGALKRKISLRTKSRVSNKKRVQGNFEPHRARQKTTAKLKKELWAVFTAYIKKRDNYICQTCGKKVEGRNAQGGHYIAKGACGLEYYFSETNVACQCAACNLYLEGNRPAFRKYILKKYGKGELEDLELHHGRQSKWTPEEFGEKIDYYKELLSSD